MAYLDAIPTCVVLPSLVYFSFVLGALSNGVLNLPVSHVLASEGGSVASSGSWGAALLFVSVFASLAAAEQVRSN